jgi:uncharacterized protein YbjT (DUF2867 family)
MASILVFGASGQIGGYLMPMLTPHHRSLGASRAARFGQSDWVLGDLGDPKVAWPAVDAVISLGPLDSFSGWLQRYRAPTLRRVIAMSSMSAQSKLDSRDPYERALSERLRGAETRVIDACAARGIAGTIFRPTLIYGAGRDLTLAPIARWARRWRVLPWPIGASGLRQPVHARDLASACVAALDRPATFGNTYPLGGGERLRFDAMLLRLREALPRAVLPIPVPIFALQLVAAARKGSSINAAMLARLREPLVADNLAAQRDLAYAPAPFTPRDVFGPVAGKY